MHSRLHTSFWRVRIRTGPLVGGRIIYLRLVVVVGALECSLLACTAGACFDFTMNDLRQLERNDVSPVKNLVVEIRTFNPGYHRVSRGLRPGRDAAPVYQEAPSIVPARRRSAHAGTHRVLPTLWPLLIPPETYQASASRFSRPCKTDATFEPRDASPLSCFLCVIGETKR